MKIRQRIGSIFLIAMIGTAISAGAADTVKAIIPERELMQALAKHFPSWKFARCAESAGGISLYTVKYITKQSYPTKHPWRDVPCRVNGDFDGDGTLDAAVQLERRDGSSQRTIVVVVFRRQGALLPIFAGEGDDTLGIAKKGTIDRDYAGEGSICYENDAIYVGHDESGGVSLVFKDGRFLVFITGD
jgi:hypothetical protein